MHKRLNPKTIAPPVPAGCFSHAIEVARTRAGSISRDRPASTDGQTPTDFAGQAEQTFANIQAILVDAGMEVGDLVKLVVYVLRPEDLPDLRRIRNQFLGDARPAQTLARRRARRPRLADRGGSGRRAQLKCFRTSIMPTASSSAQAAASASSSFANTIAPAGRFLPPVATPPPPRR